MRYRKPDRSQTDKRGFKTKREADLFLASVTVSKATGEYIDPAGGRITVGMLAAGWLASKRVELKPSSYSALACAWGVYVQPRWGGVPVASIPPSMVADWIVQLQAGTAISTKKKTQPLAASTVIRAHGVLAGVLDRAVADRRLPVNPARGVPLPRKPRSKTDRHYLTHGQVELLAREARAHAVLVRFLAYSGLRWGEAIALRVGDVDLLRGKVHVRQNAPRVNGRYMLGTPKNHEARTVPVPAFLIVALRDQVRGRPLEEYVFGNGKTMVPVPTHRDGWFAHAKTRAHAADRQFPIALTLHDLRHTAASLAVSARANVKAVQRMLGHASAAMTLDVYADLFDDDLDLVAHGLDAARAAAFA